jgi:hypothetical protein
MPIMDEMDRAKSASESTGEHGPPPKPGAYWDNGRWKDKNGFQILPEGYGARLAQEMCDNIRTHAADPDYEKKRLAKSLEDGKGWHI